MRALASWLLLSVSGTVHAEGPSGLDFDIRLNHSDQREIHQSVVVPDLTTQGLQIDSRLRVQLSITAMQRGGRWIAATLIDTSGDAPHTLLVADWPLQADEPWRVQQVSFSVCGERLIVLRDAAPGRCAALPPMAKPDRLLGRCGADGLMCKGPYEGMPTVIGSHERIAPADEPGIPLIINGIVRERDGRPRAGVIVYGYQTNSKGDYPRATPARSFSSQFHGRLRGWARTDEQGRYRFETIRPGSYGGNPEHVHMHVIEPGCATYAIDDLVFQDDPNLLALTPAQRKGYETAIGGLGIGRLRREGEGWAVTRDILLGQNVEGYGPCPGR